ncbi:hypothetical protein FBZ93_102111 [Bradyrhizobium macuxiense]|uniref:Uncharacterized protein n=1 Tax=Bradyrhizobium macuxiense TaxID=1755647 RepID=A0A560MDU8_9BRAD|nr:hypothetical protein [Bradyrhizobium macuxiense]TWC05798.1 hypothetical protein FBZ93_102111 [Bradyrhizobium macuxiense]
MKLAGLVTIAALVVATAAPALAQGTGQITQGAQRYSIDGPGGGVPTSRPQATRPVPPATPVYPYGRPSRYGPPIGQRTNVPLGSR